MEETTGDDAATATAGRGSSTAEAAVAAAAAAGGVGSGSTLSSFALAPSSFLQSAKKAGAKTDKERAKREQGENGKME